jgi:hypothetical protein
MPHTFEPCYLCGKDCDPTRFRDHVPPKGIFPKGLRENLITVPCCQKCNHSNHKADEFFRLYVSLGISRSPTAQASWKHVVESTLAEKRLPKEVARLTRRMEPFQLPDGQLAYKSYQKARPINLQLIRITKGILRREYPNVDYFDYEWFVRQLDQLKMHATVRELLNIAKFEFVERGEGSWRCFHGMTVDKPDLGMWIHIFHDSQAFIVMHQIRDTKYPRKTSVKWFHTLS